ncbi:V-set domain containing T-cell activation inhibitor 1-like [Mixophyes fleayi]|uniref:V-set domain containing T-cell activation inhibitor 1-like n=1 Tax=Mixophyes fleayi TaxID=3061075 RepID=UPI003F4DDB98
MDLMMLIVLGISLQTGQSLGEAVTTHLYGTVQLPCSFPFVQDGVSVLWEKIEDDGRKLVVHKYIEGRDSVEEQDSQYRGRTELSKEFSMRRLDLKLSDVTFSDEGTYYCRAAHEKGHGDTMVKLSIDRLDAGDPTVTLLHIDGKRRMKCIGIGVYRDPLVKWTNRKNEDLSSYGTSSITTLSDGRQVVESVLNYDADIDEHYLCHITEGKVRRSARAVISDGEKTVTYDEL